MQKSQKSMSLGKWIDGWMDGWMDVSKSLEQTSSLMFFVFLVFFLGGRGQVGREEEAAF